MFCPDNSLYIIVGEVNTVVTAMRRSNRYSHIHQQEEEQDSLLRNFNTLKETIISVHSIDDLEPICYLAPFLDVIRSENTSGLVTGHGLSAIYKFLAYGLIDVKSSNAAVAAENISDAVTHARFMMVDASSDEVVLMKITQVLRLLLLTPLGTLLTNESVCEIIQSFFRMCFETRFSEILRKTAESALIDTVQLLFSRLPQFTEDLYVRCTHVKKLKMQSNATDKGHYYRKKRVSHENRKNSSLFPRACSPVIAVPNTKSSTDCAYQKEDTSSADMISEKHCSEALVCASEREYGNEQHPCSVPDATDEVISSFDASHSNGASILASEEYEIHRTVNDSPDVIHTSPPVNASSFPDCKEISEESILPEQQTLNGNVTDDTDESVDHSENEYINPRGVRFTPHQLPQDGSGPLIPYGLPCVRELFRLLVSLISLLDRHNTEITIQIGINLLTISLEAGADSLGMFGSVLSLVKDEMCRNMFSLLSSDRLTIFAATLRVFFLLFEALRTHLKFQLEMFLQMLMDVVVSESSKVSYEQREMSLDCITQLLRIPGFVTELFINYDSDLYCSNLFEDLTKLLSKNAFPLSGLYSVHLLSLDALLAVVDNIETHCHSRMLSENKFCPEKELGSLHSVADTSSVSKICVVQEGASGYLLGRQLNNFRCDKSTSLSIEDKPVIPVHQNRMKISSNIPSHEELMAIKHKKKILASGTEQFNSQPCKGIIFLQEHGLLKKPLESEEVANFLRDNPQLDKKMIGEYISNRKNLKVLEAFVRSFTFEDIRIDEALRQYLETFRLPGEAPLISLIMEHFAEHWHKSNKEPFANSDAAFTLAYAIIMLNVDQHNHNVKKQSIPMTFEEFKKNLKNVNGGEDFNEDMLEQIYTCIRSEEIVMPAEQTGLVRENYQWKVLLRRGSSSKEGKFIHAPDGIFDNELFSLVWGPTVAALSFMFDKSNDSSIIQKTIDGFHKCAMIAAHYGMCEVFDNLVISVCKFTSLVNSTENPKVLPISFGNNIKAQMATKAVFKLAHCHGDILREGWKNLLDCILHLFKAKLLPQDLVEAEDFVSPKGIISLVREDIPSIPRAESGLFSSFYSYITSDSPSQRILNHEDELAKQAAINCIKQCHCEQLFAESKFLRIDSLQELVKTLIFVCPSPESSVSGAGDFDEDAAVFVLEILIKVVLLNRDRVMSIWAGVQDHLFSLVINAAATENAYLLERTVVGIFRITVRLARKEEMVPEVVEALKVLLFLKTPSLMIVSRQVAYALHELFRTSAANIHSQEHYSVIFSLLERVGAGAKPSTVELDLIGPALLKRSVGGSDLGAQSDSELSIGRRADSGFVSERGYTSDSELYESPTGSPYHCQDSQKKLFRKSESVNENGDVGVLESVQGRSMSAPLINQYNIILHRELVPHDFLAFLKCCESLAFLVRDAAHITAENFESCVHCIRTFLEASSNGGHSSERRVRHKVVKEKKLTRSVAAKKKERKAERLHAHQAKVYEGYDADDEDKHDEFSPAYQQASLQLLDLMHTLHTRASSIFGQEHWDLNIEEFHAKYRKLWSSCWCPLLQGIAWLCCDARRTIRTSALTLLPRALLIPDLQLLSPAEWEACFNKVLFPLLSKLLENISQEDPIGMEETRMRGATLLCKVFLQHLTPLLTLPTFMALWLTILDFMDKYMHADGGSGLLAEAIPESLKNMLLVMDTAGVFQKQSDAKKNLEDSQMWHITWDRINAFLPGLKSELFGPSLSSFVAPVNTTSEFVSDQKRVSEPSPTVIEICHKNSPDGEESRNSTNCQEFLVTTSPSVSIAVQQDETVHGPPAVILHPPVSPPVYITSSASATFSSSSSLTNVSSSINTSPAVPLLLNPSVISESHMPVFNTQV